MNRVVDRDSRRTDLAEAVWRVVGRDGVEGVTLRSVAREVGRSTKFLTHYFSDKGELLAFAYAYSWERGRVRFGAHLEALSGLEHLRELVCAPLPVDDEGRLATRVWLAFLGHALARPVLRGRLRLEEELYYDRIVAVVDACCREGSLPSELDRDAAASALLALVSGIALEAIVFPERHPPERQRAMVDSAIASLVAGREPAQAAAQGAATPSRYRRTA
jgi:AcrR family transcriptional regulator